MNFYERLKAVCDEKDKKITTVVVDCGGNKGSIASWKKGTVPNYTIIDSSFLAGKNQQEQKEVIQKLISDIAHQTLTPISNLKIYGEILSEVSNENQEEIATILEQTEKLDFLIQSLVKLSRMESVSLSLIWVLTSWQQVSATFMVNTPLTGRA